MTPLWLHNSKFARYSNTFFESLCMTVFKNIYHSKFPSKSHGRVLWTGLFWKKNMKITKTILAVCSFFSSVLFPSLFEAPMFNLSDSLSELLVLGNCGVNYRLFSLDDILLLDISLKKTIISYFIITNNNK